MGYFNLGHCKIQQIGRIVMKRVFAFIFFISLFWFAFHVMGGSSSLVYFEPRQIISSEDVNNNFRELESRTCENREDLTQLEEEISNLNLQLSLFNEKCDTILIALGDISNVTSLTTIVEDIDYLLECKDTLNSLISANNLRLSMLEEKTQFIHVEGNTTIFEATNVQIINGAGSTNTMNGLGNLIIGYNENNLCFEHWGDVDRNGSHNLIIGDNNEYSSYCNISCGRLNRLRVPFCAIFGYNMSGEHDFCTIMRCNQGRPCMEMEDD